MPRLKAVMEVLPVIQEPSGNDGQGIGKYLCQSAIFGMYASAMENRAGSVAFETPRLLLRAWEETDRVPFAEMNADAQVMCYFPSALTADETDAFLERIRLHFEQHGFGLWAVALKDTNEFTGYIGLAVPSFKAHFTPCVEIGWRLAARFWNRGLATEGAAAVLSFAHDNLALNEVVSFTVAENVASRRVMEKIGMIRDLQGDFDHPRIPKDHPLCRHVLYRSKAPGCASFARNC